MAIDLNFFMQTSANSAALLAECNEVLSQLPAQARDLSVRAAVLSRVRKELLNEALNFEATAGLQFRLNTRADVNAQMHATFAATLQLLQRHDGDAALIINGDVVYFWRCGDTLTINARTSDAWTAERLALIHGPFVRADIADF